MDNNFYTKKGDFLARAATHLFYAVRQLELAVKLESTVNPDGDEDLNYLLDAVRASFKDAEGQQDACDAMVAMGAK